MTGPARGPEKCGGRKSLHRILKRTKPTRPPKKIKTPQFWATSKWKFKNLEKNLEKKSENPQFSS